MPGVVQDPEVLGHVGLAGTETIDELADVLLAVVEQGSDHAEPGCIAEHTEAFGHVFEQFGRKGLGHVQHYITMYR